MFCRSYSMLFWRRVINCDQWVRQNDCRVFEVVYLVREAGNNNHNVWWVMTMMIIMMVMVVVVMAMIMMTMSGTRDMYERQAAAPWVSDWSAAWGTCQRMMPWLLPDSNIIVIIVLINITHFIVTLSRCILNMWTWSDCVALPHTGQRTIQQLWSIQSLQSRHSVDSSSWESSLWR